MHLYGKSEMLFQKSQTKNCRGYPLQLEIPNSLTAFISKQESLKVLRYLLFNITVPQTIIAQK